MSKSINLATEDYVNEAIAEIELKEGPQGPQGEQGEKGDKGDQGETGTFDELAEFLNLETNDKTVIGAINELVNALKQAELPAGTKMYYGFIPYTLTVGVADYSEITLDMIKSGNTVTAEPQTKSYVSVGYVPAGCFMIIAVPTLCKYAVSKDNGMGAKVEFNTNDTIGANGMVVQFDDVEYQLYGELALVDGERFIYID